MTSRHYSENHGSTNTCHFIPSIKYIRICVNRVPFPRFLSGSFQALKRQNRYFNWRDKGLSCILFKSVKYYYYVIIFVCFFVVVVVFFLQFEGGGGLWVDALRPGQQFFNQFLG